ncbi:DUF4352 domain-containing protein [Kibdelosporangium aridum]|nr:DUF4352 domain-containing protein [Kibdelosporangium aridum]
MRTAASLALLMTVALTAAITAGCSSAQSDTAGEKPAESSGRDVNKSVTVKTDDGSAKVSLVSVSESFKADNGTKAKTGNFVAVKLRFECEDGKYSASPSYIKLKQPDGTVLESDAGNADRAVSLKQGITSDESQLVKGTSAEGIVAFDAPYDPGAKLLVTGVMGHILAQWPLSGGEPILGEGLPKREINKTATIKDLDSSAVATLVSVTETNGGGSLDKTAAPESGNFVIIDMKFEGKTGTYRLIPRNVHLKKPDGTTIDSGDGNGSWGVDLDAEELQSTDLSPGKTATGKVSFDSKLEPGTKIVVLDYKDKALAEWSL